MPKMGLQNKDTKPGLTQITTLSEFLTRQTVIKITAFGHCISLIWWCFVFMNKSVKRFFYPYYLASARINLDEKPTMIVEIMKRTIIL